MAEEIKPLEDYIPKGWEIIKDQDVSPTLNKVDDLELVNVFTNSEKYVVGETVRQRGIETRPLLGFSDAVWLFNNNLNAIEQKNLFFIPEVMRSYIIVFAGTVLRDQQGERRVAHIHWCFDRWLFRFHWLDCGNFVNDWRLACLKQ